MAKKFNHLPSSLRRLIIRLLSCLEYLINGFILCLERIEASRMMRTDRDYKKLMRIHRHINKHQW